MVLVLLLVGQEKAYIDRLDKAAYLDAVDLCQKASGLLESNLSQALQVLAEVHDKLDRPDRPGLKICERILAIEIQAGERKDHPFFPYQLRGRARMKLAARASTPEERRKWWTQAVADLKKSVELGAVSSKEDLEAAQRELAKLPAPEVPKPRSQIEEEWAQSWSRLKGELAPDRFPPADGTLAGRAGALLRRLPAEASPKEAEQTKAWLAGQVEQAQREVSRMNRSQAKAIHAWSQALAPALEGIEPLGGVAEALGRLRAESAQRAEFRGAFSLKIGPSPFAEGLRLYREGEEVPLRIRATPLVLTDLEIGDYRIEMSNPQTGPKTFTLQARDLKAGRTFILTGRMKEGAFTLSESP